MTISRPASRRAGLAVTLASVLLPVAVACTKDTLQVQSSTTTTAAPAPNVTTTAPPSTELIPSPPTSAAATTVPVVDTDPPQTMLIPVSTVAAASTSPATTEPIAIQELVLTGEGIGLASFGASPDGVIAYVSSLLGAPTDDTGWVGALDFAACDGTRARRVDWGSLALLFGDESTYSTGRDHFLGWEYGRVGSYGDEPVGLRTGGGLTLGGRIVDLLAEFPDASINPPEIEEDIPANFYVSDTFYGLLSGVDADDFVTVLLGGYGCGS